MAKTNRGVLTARANILRKAGCTAALTVMIMSSAAPVFAAEDVNANSDGLNNPETSQAEAVENQESAKEAETAFEKAKAALEESNAKLESAEADKAAKEKALSDANAKWEKEKQAAAEAKKDDSAIGKAFLDSLSESGYSIDELVSDVKKITAKDEATGKAVSELAGTESFDKAVKSACTKDNLLRAAELIEKCNNLRASEGLEALKISPKLMIASIVSNAVSEQTTSHTLATACREDTVGKYGLTGENLAWGYSDPFDGWYTEEKAVYEVNGNTFAEGTGHYANIISAEYTATGLACPTANMKSCAQAFGTAGDDAMTVSEFKEALEKYFSENAAKDSSSEKPDYVLSAEADLASAEETLAAAKKANAAAIADYTIAEKKNAGTKKSGTKTSKKTEKAAKEPVTTVEQAKEAAAVDGEAATDGDAESGRTGYIGYNDVKGTPIKVTGNEDGAVNIDNDGVSKYQEYAGTEEALGVNRMLRIVGIAAAIAIAAGIAGTSAALIRMKREEATEADFEEF